VRVDYSDHPSLVSALRSVNAHTVIAILGFTPTSSSSGPDGSWFRTQINLLEAAKEAGAKRFAPSEFGIGVEATPRIDTLAGNVRVWEACRQSGLEWTRFECGLFMNYLGFGVPVGERREEALGGRERDGEWFFYTSSCEAELPLTTDGKYPRITLTAVEDIGKFIARSIELPEGSWETTSYMAGETLGMDQVVALAEKVMLRKWEVRNISPEDLERQIEALEKEGEAGAGRKMWAQLGLSYSRDKEGEGWLMGKLNELFPDVEPLSVEGYLRRYYG